MSFSQRQEELLVDAQSKQRRLLESAAAAAQLPWLLVSSLAASCRSIWFRIFSGQLFLQLDAKRHELHSLLSQKHLGSLGEATKEQRDTALQRFRREYAFRSIGIWLSWALVGLLWHTGSALNKTCQWLSRNPPFRWIDASWRPAVLSLSVVALISLAIFDTPLNWTLFPNTPANPKTANYIASYEVAFPTDRPLTWPHGAAGQLLEGFDQTALARPLQLPEGICAARSLLVVGAASVDGDTTLNSRLARERAALLAHWTTEAVEHCNTSPEITLVALFQPLDENADAAQRRAFILATSSAGPTTDLHQWPAGNLLISHPATYRRREFCTPFPNCEWQSTDQK